MDVLSLLVDLVLQRKVKMKVLHTLFMKHLKKQWNTDLSMMEKHNDMSLTADILGHIRDPCCPFTPCIKTGQFNHFIMLDYSTKVKHYLDFGLVLFILQVFDHVREPH